MNPSPTSKQTLTFTIILIWLTWYTFLTNNIWTFLTFNRIICNTNTYSTSKVLNKIIFHCSFVSITYNVYQSHFILLNLFIFCFCSLIFIKIILNIVFLTIKCLKLVYILFNFLTSLFQHLPILMIKNPKWNIFGLFGGLFENCKKLL